MFELKTFKSHSGKTLGWKIECDDLTDDDIECLAFLISKKIRKFKEVYGVPRGGLRLADALKKYCSTDGGILIVDDVLTTGTSMEKMKNEIFEKEQCESIYGVVIFARGTCPDWITPIFETHW